MKLKIGISARDFLLDELSDKKRRVFSPLALNLRYVLGLGRFLGILPLNVTTPSSNQFEEGIGRLGSILGTTVLGFSAIFTAVEFFNKRIGEKEMKAGPIAREARNVLFIFAGFFAYSYFLVQNRKFRMLFKTWEDTNQNLIFRQADLGMKRVSKLVSGIVVSSAVLGFLLQQAKLLPFYSTAKQLTEEETFGIWKIFVWRSFMRRQSDLVGFNIWFDTFILITNQLAFVSANFTDLLIILLARTLQFSFEALSHAAQTTALQYGKMQFWDQVRADHLRLCTLLVTFESFLSPVIFVSYSLNLYSLCLQVHEAMLPSAERNGLESAHALWFGCHLLLRMSLVTYFGAKLNDAAHEITLHIQKWPTDHYSTEMERLERYLGSNPIGLSGLNCFLLSRPFVLVIFSILFTIEIVLLQAIATN